MSEIVSEVLKKRKMSNLNPIANVWEVLKNRVTGKYLGSVKNLEEAIQKG